MELPSLRHVGIRRYHPPVGKIAVARSRRARRRPMEIPVLIEPTAGGFRATTGRPLALTADGPTADAAVAALQSQLAGRLRSGTQLRTIAVNGQPEPGGAGLPAYPTVGGIPLRPLGEEGVKAILELVE